MTKKAERYNEEFKVEAFKTIDNNGGNISTTDS